MIISEVAAMLFGGLHTGEFVKKHKQKKNS